MSGTLDTGIVEGISNLTLKAAVSLKLENMQIYKVSRLATSYILNVICPSQF